MSRLVDFERGWEPLAVLGVPLKLVDDGVNVLPVRQRLIRARAVDGKGTVSEGRFGDAVFEARGESGV